MAFGSTAEANHYFKGHAPFVISSTKEENLPQRTCWALILGLYDVSRSADRLSAAVIQAVAGNMGLFRADEHVLTGGIILGSPAPSGAARIQFVTQSKDFVLHVLEADCILDGELMTLRYAIGCFASYPEALSRRPKYDRPYPLSGWSAFRRIALL